MKKNPFVFRPKPWHRKKKTNTAPPEKLPPYQVWWDELNSTPLRSLPQSKTRVTLDTEWMAREGVLVFDRGYPEVNWVCSITIGNHVIYHKHGQSGGYPYQLALAWRKASWKPGGKLGKHSVAVPGHPHLWWIPKWALPTYLKEVGALWDKFARSIYDVCVANPDRYLKLRAGHRRWEIMTWVQKVLGREYPNLSVLTAMGFPSDKRELVLQLTAEAMKNYPSPQELMNGVIASKPWFVHAAPVPLSFYADYVPPPRKAFGKITPINATTDFTPWDHQRVNTMALEACEKHWWELKQRMHKILKWLTPDPKTNRYYPLIPVMTCNSTYMTSQTLKRWMGPAADTVFHEELAAICKEIPLKSSVLTKTAPDNPWRLHYRHRLNRLLHNIEQRDYKRAVLAWWRTGDPQVAPKSPASPVWPKP